MGRWRTMQKNEYVCRWNGKRTKERKKAQDVLPRCSCAPIEKQTNERPASGCGRNLKGHTEKMLATNDLGRVRGNPIWQYVMT